MNYPSQVSSFPKRVREKSQGTKIFQPHKNKISALFPSIILLILHTPLKPHNRSVVHCSPLEGHMSTPMTPSAHPYCSCSSLAVSCSMPVVYPSGLRSVQNFCLLHTHTASHTGSQPQPGHSGSTAAWMLLVKSSLIIPVFQSWPDSEAQQQSWSLECSQRRINGVSGYTRLHQLRPRMIFSSAVLPTTFTAPLPWKQLLPYFPDFSYLLSRYSHLTFHLSPPFHPFWSPPNVFQSTMETPTHSCTPPSSFQRPTITSPDSLI